MIFGFATYSIFTGLAGFASSPTEFGILRFFGGLGLGGVIPIALLS
jgi:AAHS family benzoate transporter-like MFS transporter